METAIDCATDELVHAESALHRQRYRCAKCYANVIPRLGDKNAAHFAHESGKADRDCEDYFGGSYVYRGRRRDVKLDESRSESQGATEIYFDVEESGPRLSIWIPPAEPDAAWNGYVDVVTATVNRRLHARALRRGHLVSFPLQDSQWSISVSEGVPASYSSALGLGPASLESGLNIFDATRSPGRQIGPAARLCLGAAVWVVTRDSEFAARVPVEKVTCDCEVTVGGWYVFLVVLPGSCNPLEMKALMPWLQRQIRQARARVWIENPLPTRVTQHGLHVFSKTHGSIHLRSDRPLSLEITHAETGKCVLKTGHSQDALWIDVTTGQWIVRGNGSEFLRFEVWSDFGERPAPILVENDGERLRSLYLVQERIDSLKAHGRSSTDLRLSWSTPNVGRIIEVNGRTLENHSQLSERFVLVPGITVRAGNLGVVKWDADEVPVARRTSEVCSNATFLRSQAAWLLTVASRNLVGERISFVPPQLLDDEVFRKLKTAVWKQRFAAQVRSLAKSLEKLI